ncbi:hypothetical protein CSB93_3145 [Pseudomonas paraeruginosa]|uniref:Uncharacterized protein n=1 Tax=Pseudomonas paraeruginosa TaxID=2994495 RepID=A0A2R3J0K6_9PSED|nr:hypothetical protein CSB93_3145 [Pseudomonas paraeruginosa]
MDYPYWAFAIQASLERGQAIGEVCQYLEVTRCSKRSILTP